MQDELPEPAPTANSGVTQPAASAQAAIAGGISALASIAGNPDLVAMAHARLLELLSKPGYKTSEFALVGMFIVAVLLLALSHVVDPTVATLSTGAASLIFATIRTNHKAGIITMLAGAISETAAAK